MYEMIAEANDITGMREAGFDSCILMSDTINVASPIISNLHSTADVINSLARYSSSVNPLTKW